ncbi:MAG: type II toxin-antitoxin system VapC family toxin [Solirubrobacterales bacterium]
MTHERGLIDTSVAIALEVVALERLPSEVAISTLTLAELTSGPVAALTPVARAQRQDHLQRIEAGIESLDFDPVCARAYGRVSAAFHRIGRKPRGARAVDLMIAATALAHGLPLYTRNAADLRGLEGLIEIVDVA